ncbi:ABC transporter ATP-binding protein [Aciditerrimonas ferrireducens]|uniref:ABC transporter ATP-binding protein n=1 Tax=Aciditerrimonas ferrireducens TaxID=667306 RepID=UPI00289F6FEF|nr:sn-glycerol-3-phosphate ABC transporter ATP-binding protein UgpC [Aciditerrimonas ferrireducens]
MDPVPAIAMEGLTKVYPTGQRALDALDLEVKEGEFLVLVGPSGCGKTTALRLVAGLEEPTGGVLRIGDRDVTHLPPKDRDVAMVFQHYALYPHMTIEANMAFPLRTRRLPKAAVRAKVLEVARLLDLEPVLGRKPAQLSGGQRQRVAMGRAIVREPAVFLMDEPLSNLDAKLRVQMRAELLRLQRRLGTATLYVTHDQVEAMTMGDRVAVLRGGVLQQCDTPHALYQRPANLFVAGFLGTPAMNLFRAQLAEDGQRLRLGSQQLPLPPEVLATRPALAPYRGRTVAVGIRPEHLALGATGAPATLRAEVALVEALGAEQLVHFTLDAPAQPVEDRAGRPGEEPAPLRLEQTGATGTARVGPDEAVRVGSTVEFGLDPATLQFFDPEGGQALWA